MNFKSKIKTILRFFRRKLIRIFIPNVFYFSHEGFCPCCDKKVTFEATDSWLRDYFLCTNCGSKPRERALILTIEKYFPNWKNMSIHESSPINRGASIKLKQNAQNYIATQYYPNECLGVYYHDFRNENLENQTFSDTEFDIVITQDVLEHIYNPGLAFKEIARTLKKGGAHIFTVPLINKHNKTEVWAEKDSNGNPVFNHEPEFHGNPVDPKGSPVTMHWGFDIVDFIKHETGLSSKIEYINNIDFGILAEYIEVIVTIKE